MNPPRVLLIAEGANPERTSVPLVGWSHAMALRAITDAHLVTQIRNADAIRRAGLRDPNDFTAIDSQAVARPLRKLAQRLRGGRGKGWTTVTAMSAFIYYYFEHLVWQRFGDGLKAGRFDLVHRLTPLSPTTPSRLAKKCRTIGVPFILGPLNGGVPWPRWYQKEWRREKEWLAPLRDAYKLLPGHKSTYRDSAAIIVGSKETMRQLNARYLEKTFYIVENAIAPERFPSPQRQPHQGPLRMLFVGRLVPYKGADMVLDAARALLEAGKAHLMIVGDGPERQRLEQMAADLRQPDAVKFTGAVAHDEVYQHFSQADVLTFPSIREFGGGVVLEAMAMGCVPIVVNYGGPGELATPETAFALEIGDRQHVVGQLRRTLESLCNSRSCLTPMSEQAIQRVRTDFTWEAKARQVLSVYNWVLGRGEKPGVAADQYRTD